MELKLTRQLFQNNALQGSNRTFMELKWRTANNSLIYNKGSNRTFMELKYRHDATAAALLPCSNRTFMELK